MLTRIVLLVITVLLSGCATIEDLDEVESAATAPGLSPRQCVLHKRALEWLNDRFKFDTVFAVECTNGTEGHDGVRYMHWSAADLIAAMGRPYVGFRCLGIGDVSGGILRKYQQDLSRKYGGRFICKTTSDEFPTTLTDEGTVTDAEILAEAIEIGTILGPLPGAVPGGVKIPVFCPLSAGCPDDPASPFDPQTPGAPDQGDQ